MRTFWKRSEQLSPILCRLLARHRHGPPFTVSEIAKRSGLSHLEIHHLSLMRSWDTVPFGTMRRFLIGCSLDFCDVRQMKRVFTYLRLPKKFQYLKKSPEWETVLRPIVEEFYKFK